MPRLNLILQFWNLLSICGKNLACIFFRIQDYPMGEQGLWNYLLCALSHLSHGEQRQRKQQQIIVSTGWKRGRWYHRPSVRDWGKGICQDRKIPGLFCPFPAMNSTCPTPELVFYFFFFLLLSCPPQPISFFFSQAALNTLGLFLIYGRVLRGANRKQSRVVLVFFLICSKK